MKAVVAVILVWMSAVSTVGARELSVEQRVAGQRAIERVYWSHRIWPADNPEPKPSFEVSVPDSVLEAAVEDGMRKAGALFSNWGESVTAADVQAKMTRLGSETNDPRTLRELFSALHDDPFLVAECLVRPRLVDRRVRERYAWDDRFHGARRHQVQALLASATCVDELKTMDSSYVETTWAHAPDGIIPGPAEGNNPSVVGLPPAEWEAKLSELAALFGEPKLLPGRMSPVQETAEGFHVVAVVAAGADRVTTATVAWLKESFDEWWKEATETSGIAVTLSDAAYSLPSLPAAACVADTWRPVAATTLDARYQHTAVWTGAEMIIWGGFVQGATTSGARYDPATDSWTPTSMGAGVPAARHKHSAVWTGGEMIIWGGTREVGSPSTAVNTGARYDPATDRWTPTSFTGTTLPARRARHTAIWTGTQMIVWGGENHFGLASNAGDRYTPTSDTWSPMTTASAPEGRWYHTAVWTGSQMIVWGGRDYWWWNNTGGAYTPSVDTWRSTSMSGVPEQRQEHAGVWTGTEMLVWGGYGYPIHTPTDGGRYEPNANRWSVLTPTGAPEGRIGPTEVWTGTEMLVWGGRYQSTTNTGGRYDPATDTWRPTSTGAFVPVGRFDHTAVWTGGQMIVWGGLTDINGHRTNSGAAYCACPNGRLVYRDADGDGYGDAAYPLPRCDGSAPSGYSPDSSDCDDSNATVHPGAGETCNGMDEDCDGVADDGGAAQCDDGDCCTLDTCLGFAGCTHAANTTTPVFNVQPSLRTCPVLWPPEHGYADFSVADTGAVASPAAGGCPVSSVNFASCASSQPENATGTGDGNAMRDCVYEPNALHVRAERDGECSPVGRVYTTQLLATDVCGNATVSAPLEIGVWHHRSEQPVSATVYHAAPGSGTSDSRSGTNGSYGSGCGAWSSCASGTSNDPSDIDPEMEVLQAAAASVDDLRVEKGSGGGVSLNWSDPTLLAATRTTRFHIFLRDPSTESWARIAEVSSQTLSYEDSAPGTDGVRLYKVTAVVK